MYTLISNISDIILPYKYKLYNYKIIILIANKILKIIRPFGQDFVLFLVGSLEKKKCNKN